MKTRIILLALLLSASEVAFACPGGWVIVQEQSRIGFIATWEGTEFDGVFHDYDAKIAFDPGDPGNSCFDVTVDVTSADTGSRDRDEGLAEPDWFDYPRYPKATFVTSVVRAVDGGFEADATLTIKGIGKTITFPFRWETSGEKAAMHAEVTLRRTDFGIGEGEWSDGEIIGLDVRVLVDLVLKSRKTGDVHDGA